MVYAQYADIDGKFWSLDFKGTVSRNKELECVYKSNSNILKMVGYFYSKSVFIQVESFVPKKRVRKSGDTVPLS